ncbi:CE1759 family FMN reductase [Gordonia soli]|uniref:Putative NAD(P)H-dependent FMN reductase n=1 Tax=Gordonia soli NBRC 108243 TaxID=1223545 RepID=M0QCX1_9ACTN|nr:CE1759 family FMN reductase [Gordonia soli]GAC66284.1 putative NAD(P)H-dependent FMN reductase [Gordonia soli NBRC 108243]
MTVQHVVAVNAGLGDPSSTRMLVDRLVGAVVDEVVLRDAGHPDERPAVEVIDLRDLIADIGDSTAAGFGVRAAGRALAAVHAADALIVASPVFNGSYSGLFKSFVDLVDVDAMAGKPVLIAATGGSPRHSMVLDHAMRPLFAYLRTIVVPTGVYAAAEDWAGTYGDTAVLGDRVRRAAGELVDLMIGRRPRPDAGAVVGSGSGVSGSALGNPEEARQTAVEAAGIANFARLLGAEAQT